MPLAGVVNAWSKSRNLIAWPKQMSANLPNQMGADFSPNDQNPTTQNVA
jgi:hypothetical protein